MLTKRERAAFIMGLLELDEKEALESIRDLAEMTEEEWSKFYTDLNHFLDGLERKTKKELKKKRRDR